MKVEDLPIPDKKTRKQHGTVGRFVGTPRVKDTKVVTKAEKAKGHTDIDPTTDTTLQAIARGRGAGQPANEGI